MCEGLRRVSLHRFDVNTCQYHSFFVFYSVFFSVYGCCKCEFCLCCVVEGGKKRGGKVKEEVMRMSGK